VTPRIERRCAACGAVASAVDPYPFRCPNAEAGDGRDHQLADADALGSTRPEPDRGAEHPFIRWRSGLWSYAAARAGGMSDAGWIACVGALDRAVAAIDGRGFRATPFGPADELAVRIGRAPGTLWIKDETGNVAGSHKGRHLFGLALALEVLERTGRAQREETDRRGLAIASCGNAALAAAVIARAADRPLRVFIPTDAEPDVVARLRALGAAIVVCAREPGLPGDPCMRAFHAALRGGALPFCCQASENGLAVEGGMTLAWEMIDTLESSGVVLDRLFVQVGGGALASACVRAFAQGTAGSAARMPRVHAVQTESAWPLRRAWDSLRARLGALEGAGTAAAALAAPGREAANDAALKYARAHRAEFMRPWETTPRSLAHGILDDETYDWLEVLRGTVASGGWPVTVSEARLMQAHADARASTTIPVDPTGTAGLAGLMELQAAGALGEGERCAVLFTGVERARERASEAQLPR
jgi:threonine synthase